MTTERRLKLPQPNDPVSEPIINSPYGVPEWRWQLDSSTKAYAPALTWTQGVPEHSACSRLKKTTWEAVRCQGEMGARWIPSATGQRHQDRMSSNWQTGRLPGQSPRPARDLINHWTDEEACQPYFAQTGRRALTHIYLHEAVPKKAIQGRKSKEINDRYNDGIHRIAHKMATATGKTPVMAMLILYHAANHRNAVGG